MNNYLMTLQSGYTIRWQWYTGAGSHVARPQGQPTDTSPLNEENDEELGYIIPLILFLTEPLIGTGATVFLDKAFTSIKLLRLLSERGIAAVGMTRSTRPRDDPKKPPKLPPEHQFPFRKNAKAEADELERWRYMRSAYTPLPDAHGRKWWLNAQVWLDKSFVTLLNTGWFSEELRAVPRWSKADGKKVKRDCTLALFKYSKGMGALAHAHAYVHACAHMHAHAHTCMRMHMCMHGTCAHMHAHIYAVHVQGLLIVSTRRSLWRE